MNRFTQPRFLFWFLIYLGFGLVAAYGYFINGSIFFLVTNESIVRGLESIQDEVINLEGEYLVLSSRISMETTQTLGFRDVSLETIFVNLNQDSSLVFNRPRR